MNKIRWMKRIQATPTLLVLLLVSSLMTNVTVWQLSGSLEVLALEEEEVPSQETTFAVDVIVDDTTSPVTKEEMTFTVKTNLGEIDASETKAAWLARHMATVREAREEALDDIPE